MVAVSDGRFGRGGPQQPSRGLRVVAGPHGPGGVATFGGGEPRGDRLPEAEVQALRSVFGGLESEIGLGSSMGAQIATLAAAPRAKCGHQEHRVMVVQGDDGDQKVVQWSRPCRRARKRKVKVPSRADEILGIVMGREGPAGLEFIPGTSQNVLTIEPEPAGEPEPLRRPARFLACGACGRRGTCPDCGECRHCGSRAWQSMHVTGSSRSPFNPNAVSALEARAWGSAMGATPRPGTHS